MARVTLDIGGTAWKVNTRDGGEADVQRLAAMIADRWPQASRAAGDGGTPQALLLVALMLADELSEAQQRAPADAVSADMLAQLAEEFESLADTLERTAPSA